MKTNPYTKPALMGILNLTEDSFSDGSLYLDSATACLRAEEMISQGASIIDLGAESTRPGSLPVPADVQLQRLQPVLSVMVNKHPTTVYSIDTQLNEVASACIKLGAGIINDISALRTSPNMAELIAANPTVKVILMHMQGTPQTMQLNPHYVDVLAEITAFFEERISFCCASGIARENIIIDPGIGFGKSLEHNLTILANLNSLKSLGVPIAIGASRKSFINAIISSPPNQRLEGSLAAAAFSALSNVAILRVHDIEQHHKFLSVFDAIMQHRKA